MEKNKQKQTDVWRLKEDSLLGHILFRYSDWMDSTMAKCDCNWSSCLKKIFNGHNQKAIRTLRRFLYIQRHLPMEDRNPFDPDLQFLVGVAYLCGWLHCNNAAEEAHRWFRRSAGQDSPRGEMGIGYLHEKQLIANHDEIAMLSNYTSAATKRYAPAQYRLVQYYQRQSNPDREQIKNLLTDAAAQQHEPAKYLLAELYPETVHNMEYREIYGYEWAELARKQQESGTGLYAPKEETKDDLVEKMYVISTENNEMLKRQEITTQMIQTSLSGMWEEIKASEEEFRKQLEQLQQETAKYLDRISETEREDAEKFMSVLFKGDWREPGRLCDASCNYLVDAYVLMKAADKLEIRNYCGIVITAIGALEHECRRRFYDAFDSYLESIGVEAQDRQVRMNLDKPFFTLGSIGSIVRSPAFEEFVKATKFLSPAAEKECAKRKFRGHKDMIGYYCLPGTWKKNPRDGRSFTDLTRELTQNYRNPAAHAEKVMTSEDAARCCDLLGITEAHEKVDNITGALKALLWLTAPLEQKE